MRPILDVYHRILWDEEYDINNYIVGYLDRMDGIMERDFSDWERDSTSEVWIPWHRVRYVREKTGKVMWDREKRIDEIFGSTSDNSSNASS